MRWFSRRYIIRPLLYFLVWLLDVAVLFSAVFSVSLLLLFLHFEYNQWATVPPWSIAVQSFLLGSAAAWWSDHLLSGRLDRLSLRLLRLLGRMIERQSGVSATDHLQAEMLFDRSFGPPH